MRFEVFNGGSYVIYTAWLKDLSGLETNSLKLIAEGCGLNVGSKDLMDEYKTDMRIGFKEKPVIFMEYAMSDCRLLCQILYSKISTYNDIMSNIYNLPIECLFNTQNFPLTLGTIINHIWECYIKFIIFKNCNIIRLAIVKQSDLDSYSRTYSQNIELFKELQKKKNLLDFQNYSVYLDSFEDGNILLKRDVTSSKPYEKASISHIAQTSNNTTAIKNSLRTGGRSVNEYPSESFCKYVLDVDISQAYGSQLMKGIYPFGKPRVYSKTNNDSGITLRDFLHKNERNFQKYKLFKIVVSGPLQGFECDLLLSKIVSESAYFKASDKFNPLIPSTAQLPADTVLLRGEFVDATITYSLLEIIKKVSTNKELGAFYSLKVESAMYWLDSDAVDSIDVLSNLYIYDKGELSFNSNYQTVVDNRTFKWYPFSISNFIGPLFEKRKF